MHPTLFNIGSLTIYSYGVMVAIGFLVANFFIYRTASSFGFDRNRVIDITVIALVTGIIGARILYIILNLSYYLRTPLEILNLSRGGLVWYGGFFAAFISILVYARYSGYNFWSLLDLMVPYVALAQAFGRIGCFLNGCCYGIESSATYPMKVVFPGEYIPRHPTQLYSAVLLFLIFVVLKTWQDRRRFYGEIFLGYCMLYSAERFVIEFLRGDNPKLLFGLTISQEISIIVFAAAVIFFIYRTISWKRNILNSK